jgi:hypothetical protein
MNNLFVNLVTFSENTKNLILSIAQMQGCKFAHVVTETSVKIPKKYGIVGEVTKVTDKMVQLNYNYERAVNNRLQKEGKEPNFTAQSLPWGEWLLPNKIIVHKGSAYLRMYDFKGGVKSKSYYIDGKLATAEEIKVIKEFEESKNKPSNTQQGLENEVKPTVVNLDSLISLKCDIIDYNRDESKKENVALAN